VLVPLPVKGPKTMAIVEEIKSVEDLEVFKRSHQLTLKIYEISGKFPADEKFGLVSQIKRAAASIGTNLLEGGYRVNRAEYRHFVNIAKGSAGELKYHLLLARDLGYFSSEEYVIQRNELDQISRMLNGLIKTLSTPKHWH
jgi:four helix bundle protein